MVDSHRASPRLGATCRLPRLCPHRPSAASSPLPDHLVSAEHRFGNPPSFALRYLALNLGENRSGVAVGDEPRGNTLRGDRRPPSEPPGTITSGTGSIASSRSRAPRRSRSPWAPIHSDGIQVNAAGSTSYSAPAGASSVQRGVFRPALAETMVIIRVRITQPPNDAPSAIGLSGGLSPVATRVTLA